MLHSRDGHLFRPSLDSTAPPPRSARASVHTPGRLRFGSLPLPLADDSPRLPLPDLVGSGSLHAGSAASRPPRPRSCQGIRARAVIIATADEGATSAQIRPYRAGSHRHLVAPLDPVAAPASAPTPSPPPVTVGRCSHCCPHAPPPLLLLHLLRPCAREPLRRPSLDRTSWIPPSPRRPSLEPTSPRPDLATLALDPASMRPIGFAGARIWPPRCRFGHLPPPQCRLLRPLCPCLHARTAAFERRHRPRPPAPPIALAPSAARPPKPALAPATSWPPCRVHALAWPPPPSTATCRSPLPSLAPSAWDRRLEPTGKGLPDQEKKIGKEPRGDGRGEEEK